MNANNSCWLRSCTVLCVSPFIVFPFSPCVHVLSLNKRKTERLTRAAEKKVAEAQRHRELQLEEQRQHEKEMEAKRRADVLRQKEVLLHQLHAIFFFRAFSASSSCRFLTTKYGVEGKGGAQMYSRSVEIF